MSETITLWGLAPSKRSRIAATIRAATIPAIVRIKRAITTHLTSFAHRGYPGREVLIVRTAGLCADSRSRVAGCHDFGDLRRNRDGAWLDPRHHHPSVPTAVRVASWR